MSEIYFIFVIKGAVGGREVGRQGKNRELEGIGAT